MRAVGISDDAAMNRRAFIYGLGCLIAGLPGVGSAQPWRSPRNFEIWKKIPSIVVISAADDVRLPAVHEAVGFWNGVFLNLGTPFRLGRVTHSAETIPYDELRRLWTVDSYEALDRIAKVSGDIFVALSDLTEISFAAKSPWVRKALVVIGSDLTYLAPHPNGLQNMIAHELGHAVGLDHSSEAATLMCGGGVQCNFKNVRGGFLPLTRNDKLRLLEMYPPGWLEEEEPSRR
jgi:Matrixin